MASSSSLLYFATTGSSASDTNGGGGLHSVGSVTVSKAPTAAQMLSYMDANGGPIDDTTAAVYTLNGGAGTDDLITKAGQFTNTAIGHVAYIESTLEGSDAWVIVTARTDNTIEFATVAWTNGRADVVVNVGGAFSSPQVMVNKADDADEADQLVHMFYNEAQDIAAAYFDLDNVITGAVAHNAWVILESYTTTPGDNGRTKWTGDASARKGAILNNTANIIWRNGWLYDPDQITNDGFYVGAISATNVIFENCFADGWLDGFYTNATTKSSLFIGCEGVNAGGSGFYLQGIGNVAFNCVAHDNTNMGFWDSGTTQRAVLVNCLSYDNGSRDIRGQGIGGYTVAINCTMDSSGDVGAECVTDAATIILVNCTISNSTAENIDEGTGSIYAQYTNTYNPGATDSFLAGPGNLAVDPQLDSDYLPASWQLMEAGIADAGGSPSHIGAAGKPAAYDIIVAEES